MPSRVPRYFLADFRRSRRYRALLFTPLAVAALIGCSSGSTPGHVGPPPVLSARGAPQSLSTPTPTITVLQSPGSDSLSPSATPTLPHELQASLEVARRQWRNGNLADALSGYRQVVASNQVPAEVQLELGQVELWSGETEAARETLKRLIASNPAETLRRRAQLLLGIAELRLGNWDAALRQLDVDTAPDGLAELVTLRRSEALLQSGDPDAAQRELARNELRGSTNRLFLEQAGQLAETVEDPGLTAEFYVKATQYPGSAVVQSRLIEAAGAAFEQQGDLDAAVAQYRKLIEDHGWTEEAARAGGRLYELGRLSGYHAGLLALQTGRYETAREGFSEAAQSGPNAEAAGEWLHWIDEWIAWTETVDEGTVEAFQSFRSRFPNGTYATEAQFREGFLHYEDGRLEEALGVWSDVPDGLSADERARRHFWSAKALARLEREDESRARLQAAVDQGLTHYYALRARDLLAGIRSWPTASDNPSVDREAERAEVEHWLADWADADSAATAAEERARRGFGLHELGLIAEASAEFDGLIAESTDGRFLFRLAEGLAAAELWSSASQAATRLIRISPAKTIDKAPLAIQRLAYPAAYWDLVRAEAERQDVDPLLLLSLISQESDYDRFAVSSAGARGLTQVMPATGEYIAAAIEKPSFTTDDLFRPSVAIEFGAVYLAGQLEQFENDPFRALAAYNAGAGPIPDWAADDPDLFVERIDYPETRRFVQSLYRHYAVYRAVGADPSQ